MSTRSTIAVKLQDNTYRQVFCHWDGYLANNGKKLLSYYNSQALAEQVTSLGDISSLQKNYSTDEVHTFDKPAKDVTVLYIRDRLELDALPFTFKDEQEFNIEKQGEEFNYVFKDGKWHVDGKELTFELIEKETNY